MISRDLPLRALLFAPGSEPRKLRRVGSFGADAAVLDLEDAVADSEKAGARDTIRAAIPALAAKTRVVVRVNADNGLPMDADIAAAVIPGLDAIMLPKVETAAALEHADASIAAAEEREGLEVGRIRLLPIIETAAGLARCAELLSEAPDRVVTAALGSGDLAADLGIESTADAVELLYARSQLVVACRAAGLAAPIDGPWLRLDDLDGLAADSLRSRNLGFQGRVAVHPPQVEVILRAYSLLDPEELARAQRIVAAFDAAVAEGIASLRVDGIFVDYPIYRSARERLLRHQALTDEVETMR